MSHANDVAEFHKLAKILEIPASTHRIRARVYRPLKLPETQKELKQLHISSIQPLYDVERPGHSWTRNFYNLAVASYGIGVITSVASFGAGYISLKNQAGTVWNGNDNGLFVASNMCYNTTYGNDTTQGLRIGTSNAAESFENYKMGAMIDHGDAGGEMRYWGQLLARTWSSGDRKYTTVHTRYFTNHSGGSITVQEAGIVAGIYYNNLASLSYYLVARDVISPGVVVADGELFRLDYTIESTAWPS